METIADLASAMSSGDIAEMITNGELTLADALNAQQVMSALPPKAVEALSFALSHEDLAQMVNSGEIDLQTALESQLSVGSLLPEEITALAGVYEPAEIMELYQTGGLETALQGLIIESVVPDDMEETIANVKEAASTITETDAVLEELLEEAAGEVVEATE